MTWQPEALLPFTLDREAAGSALRTWARRRWFAPNALKNVAESEAASVYVPHWIIGARTRTTYRGERGEHYSETERYTERDAEGNTVSKTRDVRKTRWSNKTGVVTRTFDGILVTGTDQDGARLAKLRPWPVEQLVWGRMTDAAEHRLLACDVDAREAGERAKERMAPKIRRDCRRDIGGDEQRVHRVDTAYEEVSQRLVLLPMWAVRYRYRDRAYKVLVNASTGTVVGERPYSAVKVALAVGVALAVVGVVVAVRLVGGG